MIFKEFFKAIKIIHLALSAGIGVFILITIYINNTQPIGIEDPLLENVFPILVIVFALGALFASRMLTMKQLEKLNPEKMEFSLILEKYRGILIIKYALIEGAAFFGILVYLLTSNNLSVSVSVFALTYFIMQRPTVSNIAMDLQIRESDLENM